MIHEGKAIIYDKSTYPQVLDMLEKKERNYKRTYNKSRKHKEIIMIKMVLFDLDDTIVDSNCFEEDRNKNWRI